MWHLKYTMSCGVWPLETEKQKKVLLNNSTPETSLYMVKKHHLLQWSALTRKDELAAVTVPCGLMKAGFSLAIASRLDTRIPLSFDTGLRLPASSGCPGSIPLAYVTTKQSPCLHWTVHINRLTLGILSASPPRSQLIFLFFYVRTVGILFTNTAQWFIMCQHFHLHQ